MDAVNKESPFPSEWISGLPGRIFGYRSIQQEIAIAKRNGHPLSALWVEIDRIAKINRTFGSIGGDYVLASLFGRLIATVGDRGKASRMDNEELLFLLPNCKQDDAVRLAKELIEAVSTPLGIEGVQIHPSVSIGIALLEPDEDPFDFLIRADSAMEIAKENFGNTYYVSGEVLAFNAARASSKDMDIEARLRTGIESNGLDLHFQPAMNSAGQVVSVEALMRCNVGGDKIAPGDFIPIAEQSDLIARIGNWSLAEAAFFAKLLSDEGWRIPVSVNVSRVQLLTPGFVSNLQSALLCANIPPELLELDITETLFFDFSPGVQPVLKEILNVGVQLAIDDFGTGYSCMTCLRDTPVSKLKLDRSFIAEVPNDQAAVATVSGMVALGKAMGKIIVAEGVETVEQRDFLLQLGVDVLQGYLYSPPIQRDALMSKLQQKVFVTCQ